MKSKGDFIIDLLASKKISQKDRERILKLSAKEFEKNDVDYQRILSEIAGLKKTYELEQTKLTSKIDNLLGAIDNSRNKPSRFQLDDVNQIISAKQLDNLKIELNTIPSLISWSQLKQYENPKFLKDFLLEYNQTPILKSTCHRVDEDDLKGIKKIIGLEDYNFEKHLENIHIAFNSLDNNHKHADYKIKGRIRVYLTGKDKKGNSKTWSTDFISVNWNSSELLEWAHKNPNIPPNPDYDISERLENIGFEFDEIDVNWKNKKIQTFSDLVIHFKHMFHIRSDNPLKKIIQNKNIQKGWNELIDFEMDHGEFWSNIDLFTDVDKFIQAYEDIIKMILKIHKEHNTLKPNILLKFKEAEEKDKSIIFSIHHKNIVFKKTVANILDRPGKDLSNLIEKKINGLCNLYLRADFDNNQFAEINLWDGSERKALNLPEFEGVEHILLFPQ